MSFHHDGSLKNLPHKQDFWDNHRPASESSRSMLYRYEHDGIVVYDCYSRLSNELAEPFVPEPPKEIPSQVHKEILNSNEYGNS